MALADHLKSVIYSTVGTVISAGVIAVVLWLKGLPLHWALLVTAGFVLAVSIAAYLVVLIIERLRKPKVESQPNQNASDEAFARSNARVYELERTLSNLQDRYDDVKWLREIADTQEKAIADYVTTDCWIIEHDLLREPPFIDFQVRFHSACVYRLSVVKLQGSVRFANQRLSGDAVITQNLVSNLSISEVGWVTITQPLTRDDAIRILNQINDFYFDLITIELNASPGTAEHIVLHPRGSISSNVLGDRYPKLKMQIKAVRSFIVNMAQPTGPEPAFVTLEVHIENLRKGDIQIDTVRLATKFEGQTIVSSAQLGDIYQEMHTTANGQRANSGPLKNLANLPLIVPGESKVWGCFQFLLEGVDLMETLGHDFTSTLTLIDKFGERHIESCVVSDEP
jgi:hypothetical protein